MGGLAGFTNAFLLIFGLDASVSVLEELFRAATGSEALLGPRNFVALPVVIASFAGLPLLALTPKLPARLLLPLFLATIWLGNGAAPLPLFFQGLALGLVGAGGQALLAALAFAWVRRHNARRGIDSVWWIDDPAVPVLSPGHSLRMIALGAFVLFPLFLVYGVVLVGTAVQLGTREFVAFDRSGITLADRHYQRADREIRLVGMMHIGEGTAYRELVASFALPDTIVLEEGVTDDTNRMDEPLAYDGVADLLGLESQNSLASYLVEDEDAPLPEWPVWRHADVDLAEFAPETIAWLESARDVLAADDLAAALNEFVANLSSDPETVAAVERDVFTRRNEVLLAAIEAALPDFSRIVVPWGALHLPAIEVEILDDGFELTHSERRRLVSWGTVLTALAERQARARDVPDAQAEQPDGAAPGPDATAAPGPDATAAP